MLEFLKLKGDYLNYTFLYIRFKINRALIFLQSNEAINDINLLDQSI